MSDDMKGTMLGQTVSWADTLKSIKADSARPLSERLHEEAERERRTGDSYKGCSFIGEHPSSSHYRRAGLLDQAACLAARDEARRARRRKATS